ncbi:MAG: SUMF1/EgtB/PvdO family nonheme iron enzyme [Planctomycetota bacterium]
MPAKRLLRLLSLPFRLLRYRLVFGALVAFGLVLAHHADKSTSSDDFCASCHVHPQASASWKLSTHYGVESGVVVHCVECHLPPGGLAYYWEKARHGLRDAYGSLFTDTSQIDWEARSSLEHALTYTYEESCTRCHQNLFPLNLSPKGDEAHLHYSRKAGELPCINCHLHSGHYDERATQPESFGELSTATREIFTEPAPLARFESFVEHIPGTSVSFEMIAIPGGEFLMGSPQHEAYRRADEGPVRRVRVSRFLMGKSEVTWDEYQAFYAQTAAKGQRNTRALAEDTRRKVDAISGATPPYGNPDQGWGKGSRPAITMTHHAATVYCQWLSAVTGKSYRLPTEAEWEYACRGGTPGPYFFPGSPRDFTSETLWNKIFGVDLDAIAPYAVVDSTSGGKTHPPDKVKANPFGLLHMTGNVREFCSDWYSAEAYATHPGGHAITDPRGPESGKEHVIRGGSYASDAIAVRSAARDATRHSAWLMTDPQNPKSIWWYSDCRDVGFRIVCEFHGDLVQPPGGAARPGGSPSPSGSPEGANR